MKPALPKRMGHIWIGPKPAPDHWMRTWPSLHPDWEYTVYDNDFLAAHPFRLRLQINDYFWRGNYAGVQDMMRYEILHAYGGFMADADAICKHRVDELLTAQQAYTVWDRFEGDRFRAVCPILACEPGNAFVGRLIERLEKVQPEMLRKPEVSTGNRFLGAVLREEQPGEDVVKIWPMHYFLPWHKSAPDIYYDGPDTVYAEQQYGTSLWAYNKAQGESEQVLSGSELKKRRDEMLNRMIGAQGRPLSAWRSADAARVKAAEEQAQQVSTIENSAEFKANKLALNSALIEFMERAGLPTRFHGLYYYRHMQNNPLTVSKLKTRSAAQRASLLGWIGSARRVLLLGYDTGHLLLGAHHLAPDTEIHALESGRWLVEKDENPPRKNVYSPIATQWLNTHLPTQKQARFGDEAEGLRDLRNSQQNGTYDLIVISNTDIRSLALIRQAAPLLAPEGQVLLASETKGEAFSHAQRLQLQHLAHAPFWQDSPEGHLAALRLIAN